MDEKRWHERRHKRYHWLKNSRGHWHPEAFKDNGESMVTRLAKLNDAILEAWTHCLPSPYGSGEFSPEDGRTDCNRFVNMVAEKLGYKKFQPEGSKWPMLANKIHETLSAEASLGINWIKANGSSAQYYANHGYFVVAAWANPDKKKDGHVAVVRPGMAGTSKKWRVFIPGVPKVANVGNENTCRLDRGANWAFGEMPEYFVLLEDCNVR